MEIIDREPRDVQERSDEFLLMWGFSLLTDRSILPAERHAAAYAVLRQHIKNEDVETDFNERAVLLSRVFQPYREEHEYRPCDGQNVLHEQERKFQARAVAIRIDRAVKGWSQPVHDRGMEQLVYLSHRYPSGLGGYADEGEALDRALALVLEEKRGGEKLWNSREWAKVYWYLGREPRQALIAEANDERTELELDLNFAQRMDSFMDVNPAVLTASGRKARRVFLVYEHLLGGNDVVLLVQP